MTLFLPTPDEQSLHRIVTLTRQAIQYVNMILPSRGHILGTGTNDSAAAGEVGEVISSAVTPASLTTATAQTLTSIVLTPGNWAVYGASTFQLDTTTTITRSQVSISATTNTIQAGSNRFNSIVWPSFAPNATVSNRSGPVNQTVAAGTTLTLFWVVQLDFGVSTATANGILMAFRTR